MKLASQVQHLRHYLSAATPDPEDPDTLHPADMAEYGFTSALELLDMCSAVGLLIFLPLLTHATVLRQLVHAVHGRPDARGRRHVPAVRAVQSLV